ncbi:MAG: hypothetical protein WBU20_09030 [Candidatus Acidiferrum sp.]
MRKNICTPFAYWLALASLGEAPKSFLSGSHGQWSKVRAVAIALLLSTLTPMAWASDQTTFKIPPVKIPVNVKDQRIILVASALLTLTAKAHGLNDLNLQMTADLSDMQRNMTELLGAQLDKDDHCGDRITIQNATLTPAEPASQAVVRLHYERWACAKVFGKQQARRIVGGNALVPMKLTPAIEQGNTELKLVPQVGEIQADGSLGELLRSGTLGEMLQEKIRDAILSAMQKGTDLSATLPPAVQGHAKIKDARFKDGGAGHLLVLLDGEVQISNDQIQALSKQVKERIAAQQGK